MARTLDWIARADQDQHARSNPRVWPRQTSPADEATLLNHSVSVSMIKFEIKL